MTEREQFLKNEWSPYPESPSHCNFYGRLETLLRRVSLPEKYKNILEPRDWVSAKIGLNKDKNEFLEEIYLLAPELRAASGFSADVWGNHQKFQHFLGLIREYFIRSGFQQVTTPTLVVCPGTEPTLDVFETNFHYGKQRRHLYLPTSPELHLKKILAQVGAPIFEMRSCFRNNELGPNHQPEFSMLEFYRPFCGLETIQKDIQNLVQFLVEKMRASHSPRSIIKMSMRDLFKKHLGFDLQPNTEATDLTLLCRSRNIHMPQACSWDDLFFILFLEFIEPKIPREDLVFVEDYPPGQAALARLNPRGWGDRFEFYWQGMELGNAFHELNDPKIQKQRFLEDIEKKRLLGKSEVSLDEEFLGALQSGMPPSSGIAVGLDRLFMALMGLTSMEDFYLFPFRAL